MRINETVFSEAMAEDQIDSENGVIRNVRILGKESKNGRTYSDAAMDAAVTLYEGAPVNIDHASGRETARGFEEGFGEIRKATRKPDGIYGDLHFETTHPMAPRVLERAKRFPTRVGLSHVIEGESKPHNGKRVVERIERVISVDVVSRPATNSTFFESEEDDMAEPKKTTIRRLLEMAFPKRSQEALISELEDAAGMAPSTPVDAPAESGDSEAAVKAAFRAMVVAAFDDEKLDAKATMKRIGEILKSQEKLMGGGSAAPPADGGGSGDSGSPAAESALEKRLGKLESMIEARETREACTAILEDLRIKPTAARLKALAAVKAEDREALAETWKGLDEPEEIGRGPKPRRSEPLHEQFGKDDPGEFTAPKDSKSFARSISR